MKQSFFCLLLLLSSYICQAQNTIDTPINFEIKSNSISEAITQLSEQSGVSIAFSSRFFSKKKKVSFSFKKKTISAILEHLLQETGIGFKNLNGQVILFKKPVPKTHKYTISGYLQNAEDGEKLIAATVYDTINKVGAISNDYGFYSLTVPSQKAALTFSYLGHESQTHALVLKKNETVNISLEPSLTLSEFVVTASPTPAGETTGFSGTHLTSRTIKQITGLGGESDALGYTRSLAGVQSGADGFGGLHIRGGNLDQNLILMDGVPIYNPSHLMGIFSVFNSDAIRSASFLKGGFPARYGGRISSVFDCRTKEGNEHKISGEIGTGLLSSKITLEGPIKRGKTAFLVTARHTFPGLLLYPVLNNLQDPALGLNEDNSTTSYNFHDINAKINHRFSHKDRLYLSFYKGGDAYKAEALFDEFDGYYDLDVEVFFKNNIQWGNTIGSLRWNHLFGNKLFSNTTLTYSRYQFVNRQISTYEEFYDEELILEENYFYEYGSDIRDIAAKTDFEFMPSPKHYVRFGLGLTQHRFVPDAVFIDADFTLFAELDSFNFENIDSLLEDPETIFSQEITAYVEDDIRLAPSLKANVGLRASAFRTAEKTYFSPEPRLSIQWQMQENMQLKASAGRMVQYLHQLNNSGLGMPSDIWVSADEEVPPQDSWHTELAWMYQYPTLFDLEVSTYYKRMDKLLAFKESSLFVFADTLDFDDDLNSGHGWGYGIEVSLTKEQGNTGGFINYALSWGDRQFEDVNLGRTYSFGFDHRHAVKMGIFHHFNKRITLSADWQFSSGNPKLVVVQETTIDNLMPIDINAPGNKNNNRTPAYHRLNLSSTFTLPAKRGKHTLQFNIYNVYNRGNPAFYRFDFESENPFSFTQAVTLLPILPSVNYRFAF